VPDARVVGYRVYFGTASRSYAQSAGTGLNAGANTTYTVTNLGTGKTYYFAVTAVDSAGAESAYSAEATKSFP
jgi:fibronectin type 3 domain-containing protein